MFYPFIWSISLPSSVFLNIWYLGLLWSLFICLFGLRFPAFAWTPKTYSLQIVACNSLGSHAFAAAIPPLAIPLGESGMNYSLHTVQEECSHLVMECSGLFNAQGLKSWKPQETIDQQDGPCVSRKSVGQVIGVLTQPPNWLIWLFTHHPTPF
jgi:hypothetical protein